MRTVLSLVLLAALLWASCTVKLGRFTLAEHVDRIGETEEAKALLEGTRGKIAPVLEDMKQRVFGEYVEAPTAPPKPPRRAERVAGRPAAAKPERKPSGSEEAKLPGRAAREADAPKLPAKAVVGSSAAGSRDAKAVVGSSAAGSRNAKAVVGSSAAGSRDAKAVVGSSAAGSRDAKAVGEPTRPATRAPSTSEVARLPGARRP